MIPHRFHRLWYGPRPLPEVYRAYGESWERHNPGWSLRTHTAYKPSTLRREWEDCGTVYKPNPGGGKQNNAVQVMRADIAAYELIYEQGGVYLNCDLEARKPLPIDGLDCFLAWEFNDSFISNAVFGATAGHPFLAHVIDMLPKRIRAVGNDQPMNELTGPHLLTAAWRAWNGPKPKVFPAEMFNPVLPSSGFDQRHDEWPDAVAVHHWGHNVPDKELWPTCES